MRYRWLLPFCALLAVGLPLEAEKIKEDVYLDALPTEVRFGNEAVALRFDPASGALTRIVDPRTQVAALQGGPRPDVTFEADGKPAVTALACRFREVETSKRGAVMKLHCRAGDWAVTIIYTLRPHLPIVEREVVIGNEGKSESVVQSVHFNLPGVCVGDPAECWYSIPMNYPPEERRFGDLAPDRWVACQHGVLSAGFILVHNGSKRLSLVAARYSEEEHGSGGVLEGQGGITVEHRQLVIWQAKPGASARFGSQYICLAHGTPDDALRQAQKMYDLLGLRPPARTAETAERAVIYSAHPGGTIDSGFRDVGGFKEFTRYLPELQRIGVNTLWLLPIWKGPVYAPDDYYKLDERVGPLDDLKALVDHAHGLGIKVLLDLVPHGPRDVSGLQNEHADWVSRDERGKLLYWWGCLSCDYANPGWEKYMGDHAAYWVKRAGVDGYRVDCGAGGPPNYRPFGTNRASMSGLYGGMKVLEAARKTMEKVKPDVFLLPEACGPFMFRSADYVYDWPFGFKVSRSAVTEPPETWCANAMRWLENEKLEYPPGANFMRFLENHDTVRAEKVYGIGLQRAMMAVCAFSKGAPFLYHFQEIGYAPYLSKIYHVRTAYDELTLGEAYYQAARCSGLGVFVVLRGLGDKWSCAAVNMSPDPVECRLSLPADLMKVEGESRYVLFDAVAGKRISTGSGEPTFRGRQLSEIPLRLEGYSPAVVVVRAGDDADVARFTEEKPASFPPPAGAREPQVTENADNVRIENGIVKLVIAKDRGGLIRTLALEGGSPEGLIRSADFLEGKRRVWIGGAPLDMSGERVKAVRSRKTADGVEVILAGEVRPAGERAAGPVAGYEIIYTVDRSARVHVAYRFTPRTSVDDVRGTLTNVLSLQGVSRWFVNALEGLLYDDVVLRHTLGQRTVGRSWHGVGDRLWGSGPLPLDDLAPWLGALNEETGEYVVFSEIGSSLRDVPQRMYVTDNLNGDRGLHVVFGWLDDIRPVTMKGGKPAEFSYAMRVGRGTIQDIRKLCPETPMTGPVRVKVYGARYVVENDHYRASIIRSRGGELDSLVPKGGDSEPVVTSSEIYTDCGIYRDYKDPLGRAVKTKADTLADVEPEVLVLRRPDHVELGYRSFFRNPNGGGRSLLRPLTEYQVSYVFDPMPEIGVSCGVRLHFMLTDVTGFLAHVLGIGPMTHWAATGRAGLQQGTLDGKSGRVWESRAQGLRAQGPFVGFANDKEKRYVVVRPGPPLADLANLFLLQSGDKTGRIFFAWFDGKTEGKTLNLEPRWYGLSYKVRAGIGSLKDALTGAEN